MIEFRLNKKPIVVNKKSKINNKKDKKNPKKIIRVMKIKNKIFNENKKNKIDNKRKNKRKIKVKMKKIKKIKEHYNIRQNNFILELIRFHKISDCDIEVK